MKFCINQESTCQSCLEKKNCDKSWWVIKWLNLMAFLGTADSEVHVSHVIVAYTLESLSSSAENAKSWVAQRTPHGWWLGGPFQFWVVCQSIIYRDHEINYNLTNIDISEYCLYSHLHIGGWQGWGGYYSGTRLAQNDKHEYTKNIVLEYYSSTIFQYSYSYVQYSP